MKVIKEAKFERTYICPNCGTTFVINSEDIYKETISSLEGEIIIKNYIECPVCKKEITVKFLEVNNESNI